MYFCEDFRESYAFRSTFFIGCRESHIFPYANFWREIEFSIQSHVRLLPIDFTFDMITKIKKL